jgi:hypothetical protein
MSADTELDELARLVLRLTARSARRHGIDTRLPGWGDELGQVGGFGVNERLGERLTVPLVWRSCGTPVPYKEWGSRVAPP